MRQLAPLVQVWSVEQPVSGLSANGHFVQQARGEASVLIDPVALDDAGVAQVRALGGVAAVIATLPERVDEARRLREAFGCGLFALPGLPGIGAAEPLTTSSTLPAGIRPLALGAGYVADQPDIAGFAHAPSGSAIVSGAVVGAPAGSLGLADGVDEVQAASVARRLRALLAQPLRRVLVAEGEPVLRDAVAALQELLFRHDPASFVLRPDELVWQPPRGMGTRFLRQSAECSRLLGLRTLDFEVTVVPPGKQSTLLHSHAGYEELFIILEGEGEVEAPRGTFPIRAGDALGFPSRNHVAHAIRNTGEGDLRMLSFGAYPPPDDLGGIAEYPESNKFSVWAPPANGRRFYLPEQQHVDYWEGERLD